MIKIGISPEQRRQLEDLWFIYGNGGSKSNFNQHRFIQDILERGEYDVKHWGKKKNAKAAKLLARNYNFNGYVLSKECIDAVDLILQKGQ